MGDENKKSASIILVSGNGKNVEYNIQAREVDKSDLYSKRSDLFKKGEYCFYFPGAASIFWGTFDSSDENPKHAFIREIKEEKGIDLSTEVNKLNHQMYLWRNDLPDVINRIEDVFQRNLGSFLGFNLNEKIPSCALGPDRKNMKNVTYREWLTSREGDHYFSLEVPYKDKGLWNVDKEGAGSLWMPHQFTRALVMVPCDKLALLDDMALRVQQGKLEIKV